MSQFWKKNCEAKLYRALRSHREYSWSKWLLPIVGLISLIWFLVRVVPKPSRATYPCQRVATPLAGSFVVWLLGIIASVSFFKKAKSYIRQSCYLIAYICVTVSIGFIWVALSTSSNKISLADDPIPNDPVGVAQGINPGRVVWVHDPNATNWDGPDSGDGYWWDPNNTNQYCVDNMMSQAVRNLAGEITDTNSWDAIFKNFNVKHGKGDVGYTAGEKITIKINLSTCNQRLGSVDIATYEKTNYLNRLDTSPQMIISLLRQLVYKVGVAQSDIAVGDTVAYFPNHYWNICHTEFPDVRYLDPEGKYGRTKVEYSTIVQHWSHGELTPYETDYLSQSFADANYIINFACLKGHAAGITLCGKNHYGSYIRLPDTSGYYNLHSSLAGTSYDPNMNHYRALVDIIGHSHIGGKTILYLIDGLYGGYKWDGKMFKFQMSPFNNDWPSSLFVSQDPVAIDSVGLDFLWEEWPNVVRVEAVDDYLHEAAEANDPPSGTFYDPDGNGTDLNSLGVHEHWNNALDKQYSRNLGIDNGIELVSVTLTYMIGDLNFDSRIDFEDLEILANQWLQPPGTPSADIAPLPDGDGIVNFKDFNVLAENWPAAP